MENTPFSGIGLPVVRKYPPYYAPLRRNLQEKNCRVPVTFLVAEITSVDFTKRNHQVAYLEANAEIW